MSNCLDHLEHDRVDDRDHPVRTTRTGWQRTLPVRGFGAADAVTLLSLDLVQSIPHPVELPFIQTVRNHQITFTTQKALLLGTQNTHFLDHGGLDPSRGRDAMTSIFRRAS